MKSRLTFLRPTEKRNKVPYGIYACSCGNEKEISMHNVRYGKTLSCGCYRREQVAKLLSNHTREQDKAYKIWLGVKGRCFVKSNSSYKKYGAVGITCCDRWAESFANFWDDMGSPPDGHSLDRIDNSKGYFKENCRWADITLQARNRKRLFGSGEIKFKGVHRVSGRKTYIAKITVCKKVITVYRGKSCVDAIKARCKAEIKYFGFMLGLNSVFENQEQLANELLRFE